MPYGSLSLFSVAALDGTSARIIQLMAIIYTDDVIRGLERRRIGGVLLEKMIDER